MASGIFMRCRCSPLHVLSILLSSEFLVSLVYRIFVGLLSAPPFPPGSVSFLSFGVGVRVRVCAKSHLLFFPLSF